MQGGFPLSVASHLFLLHLEMVLIKFGTGADFGGSGKC